MNTISIIIILLFTFNNLFGQLDTTIIYVNQKSDFKNDEINSSETIQVSTGGGDFIVKYKPPKDTTVYVRLDTLEEKQKITKENISSIKDVSNSNRDSIIIINKKINSLLKNKSFTDTRDNNKYRIISIGKQIWMSENMRYETDYKSNCTAPKGKHYLTKTMGLLYKFEIAKNICPDGWRLPNKSDIEELYRNIEIDNNSNKIDIYSFYNSLKENSLNFNITNPGYVNGKKFFCEHKEENYWLNNNDIFHIDEYTYDFGKAEILDYSKKKTRKEYLACSVRCIKE